jgi:hypothetical protein
MPGKVVGGTTLWVAQSIHSPCIVAGTRRVCVHTCVSFDPVSGLMNWYGNDSQGSRFSHHRRHLKHYNTIKGLPQVCTEPFTPTAHYTE